MKIYDLCNKEVGVIDKKESFYNAALLMRKNRVGMLVVTDQESAINQPLGMVTEHDIILNLFSESANGADLTLAELLPERLATLKADDELTSAIQAFRVSDVRGMPVVNELGALIGFFTLDDVIELLAEQLAQLCVLINNENRLQVSSRY